MILFTDEEKQHARGMHADFAGAIARALVERSRRVDGTGLPRAYVAAYTHQFGTDISAHATVRGAEIALEDIATRECLRDPELRERVMMHFRRWPIADDFSELTSDWASFAPGESLWIAACVVERERASAQRQSHRLQSEYDNDDLVETESAPYSPE